MDVGDGGGNVRQTQESRRPPIPKLDLPDHGLLPLVPPRRTQLSPFTDESVRGYPTDIKPENNGVKEIVPVIAAIEAEGISCCVVGEAALIYYGAKRIMFDWLICVPTEHIDQVDQMLRNRPERFEPFRPSMLNAYGSLNASFPRFKFVGIATFFIIMSSRACHIDVNAQSIEYDRWIRVPYPKLPIYAQSLLDTWNLTNLEDLIDGMNLTPEWGEKHLVLSGTVDQDWACWREAVLAKRELTDAELPQWSVPRSEIWYKVSSTEAKKKRQGWKSRPDQLTRFWTSGQPDPRERYKEYS